MNKPSFGVVTAVVTVLAIIAFISKLAIGLIPAGPVNRLSTEQAEFMQQGSHEEIDWRPLGEDAFSDARKQQKPILLAVGSACSPSGRFADKIVFLSKEVRGFLARNFICVRVDSMAHPEYMNAFLPISRALAQNGERLAIPADYQVWFLDPNGHLFFYAADPTTGASRESGAFLSSIEEAANRFEKLQETPGQASELQSRDLSIINSALPAMLPDLTAFANDLTSSSPQVVGGFPVNGMQRLWPSAWNLQLFAGRIDEYRRSIMPSLTSPQVDLLDGGFFTDLASPNWRGIGYDKLAVTNAGMLRTLVTGAVLMHDDDQRWLARKTFDSLLTEFQHDGYIAAGRVGDEDAFGRSDHSSFSPRKLREIFPNEADRAWLRDNLGMRVETNPQMTPMLVRLDLPGTSSDKLETVLTILRKTGPTPKLAGYAELDVGGFCTARMMQAARILGDTDRLLKSEALFERLDGFRSFNDVVHSRAPGAEANAYLGDYLAYADGALQYFLATGNSVMLQNGASVLRRGLFLYGGSAKGVYNLSQPATSLLAPQDAATPEIVDNVRESCSAQVIRLCNDYGRLLGEPAADLQAAASDTLSRFAPVAPALGPYAGGYYCAAAQMQDPTYAVTVGPDALKLAAQVSALAPTRLVAPSFRGVKEPGKSPGVYVIRDLAVRGPLAPEKAAELLKQQSF